MIDRSALEFIPAAKFKSVEPGRDVRLVVIHCMEAPEKGNTAESVANYFKNGSDGRDASAHYCVDAGHIVHCVQEKDIAYGAPGANRTGIHIELAGYSAQDLDAWHDSYSESTCVNAAKLAASICSDYGLPMEWVDAAGLAAGKKGVTSHAEVTKWQNSIGKPGSHTDPGAGFPVAEFVSMVKHYSGE